MLITERVKDSELEGDLKGSCRCFLVFAWTDRKESIFVGVGSTRRAVLNRDINYSSRIVGGFGS